jgi:hypothetical protein
MPGFRAGNTAGIGLSPDWPLGLYMNDRDPPATVFKKMAQEDRRLFASGVRWIEVIAMDNPIVRALINQRCSIPLRVT